MQEFSQGEEKTVEAKIYWANIFQAFNKEGLVANPKHVIIVTNGAAVSAFGKIMTEIIGKKCYEIFYEND